VKKIRENDMKISFVFAIMVMVIGSGSVLAVTGDSATWEGSNEMDAMPPFDEWVPYESGPITTSGTILVDSNDVGNNYLHRDATGLFEGLGSWNYVASTWNNGGASFEFRCRVNSGTVLGHIFTTAETGDSHYYWLTYYLQGGASGEVEMVNSNSYPAGNTDRSMDITQWHTYRFTIDGTEWKLYVDGKETEPLTLTAVPFSGEGIPYTGYYAVYWDPSANADLDYMRYTDAGALSPLGAPPACGDNGYKVSDFNTDCYVNLEDLVYMVSEWLFCTDPAIAACDEYWQ
jgi:hypothetical protein